jgi:hypothetical protein
MLRAVYFNQAFIFEHSSHKVSRYAKICHGQRWAFFSDDLSMLDLLLLLGNCIIYYTAGSHYFLSSA